MKVSNTPHDQEVVSKVFPPLIWEDLTFKQRAVWPFPVRNGERTEASMRLLGVRERRTRRVDDCSDMQEALW